MPDGAESVQLNDVFVGLGIMAVVSVVSPEQMVSLGAPKLI